MKEWREKMRDLNKGNKYAKGKHHRLSTETKTKIGLSKKNKKRPPFSSDWRKKISDSKKGNKHPNWKGGGWLFSRRIVLVRDDYRCQICGLREPEIMEVDHIKPKSIFPEIATLLENLITICPNCHRRKTNRETRQKYNKENYVTNL